MSTALNNPYWDAVQTFPNDSLLSDGARFSPDCYPDLLVGTFTERRSRWSLVMRYSWAIPSNRTIRWMGQRLAGQKLVEIGAGTGYWAWLLEQVDVPVVCYDLHLVGQDKNIYFAQDAERYHPILRGGPEKAALWKDRALFLCWPPYDDSLAVDALSYYQGDTLVYVGEGDGGCCGDDAFWKEIERGWNEVDSYRVVQWSGLHDWLTIYERTHVISEEP